MSDGRRLPPGHVLAVLAALAIIAAATLTPQLPNARLAPWYVPFMGPGDGADALLNIVLFMPLGMALGIARLPRARSVKIAIVTTVAVELLQAFVIPGRQASIGDVLTNTLGGWLGHAGTQAAIASARADVVRARRLAGAYAAAWLAATLGAAASLRPALPQAAAQRARCGVADLPDCFPGTLASPLVLREPGRPDVVVADSGTVPVGPDVSLVVEVIDGGIAWSPGRVAGIATRPGGSLLSLEQGSHGLVFLARTRGASYGLRTPAVTLRGVLGRPGRRVAIEAGVTGNLRWLQVDGRRAELRLSAAEGWRLLFPWSAARRAIVVTVSALFNALTLLPLGFWTMRASRRGVGAPLLGLATAAALAASLAVLAFALGGWALGLGPARATDWLGAVGGAVVGAVLAWRGPSRSTLVSAPGNVFGSMSTHTPRHDRLTTPSGLR